MRRSLAMLAAVALLLFTSAGSVGAGAAPANDSMRKATVITEPLPFATTEDTSNATASSADNGCGAGGVDQATVWFKYTPSASARIGFDASASSYFTGVNLFSGSPGSLQLLACQGGGLAFDLVSGTTYYLMVADIDGDAVNGGILVLKVDVAPPPIQLTLTVGSATLTKNGSVIVSGTVTCSRDPLFVELFGQVSQQVGRIATIRGSFFAFLDTPICTSGATWSGEAFPESGLFKGGQATVFASAFGCDLFDCSFADAVVYVRLH